MGNCDIKATDGANIFAYLRTPVTNLMVQTCYVIMYIFQFSAKAMPFRISFLSDQFEFTAEDSAGIQGFKLKYFLTSC